MEVSDNARRGLNNSRRYQLIRGGGLIFPGGMTEITEGVKYFMEVSNKSRRGLNNSRRYAIIHGGG